MKERRITAEKAIETLNKLCNLGDGQVKYILEEENKEDNCIDLDIDNLPERFFTRDDIEIESRWKEGEWLPTSYSQVGVRGNIILEKQQDSRLEYRYRIQEKKPIQITRYIWHTILYNPKSKELLDGREVIIID